MTLTLLGENISSDKLCGTTQASSSGSLLWSATLSVFVSATWYGWCGHLSSKNNTEAAARANGNNNLSYPAATLMC